MLPLVVLLQLVDLVEEHQADDGLAGPWRGLCRLLHDSEAWDGTLTELADAIGAALSLDTWTVLRRRDGLSLERAIAVWRLTLTALLSQALGAQKA